MIGSLTGDLADRHVRDLRDSAAARRDGRATGGARTGHRDLRPRPLRRQVGFALIEAGLYLVSGAAGRY